ncbi:MarR family winged helix-turn-helix transcriptional regulator [Deinococcus sp.]|uniref:MarR family winged helix-turn-helix transcriptional regulator n=1 Tax=Deinococcus sp. TaxID=47478 RepID=UPI003B5A2CB5
MKRRTPRATSPPEQASNPTSLTAEVQWEPLPAGLARWTGYALHWVTNLAGQLYGAGMAQIGLLPPHVAILQMLHDEGEMNQNALARRTRIDKAPLVGLLNSLEEQGCIERRPYPGDKRAYVIHLTAAGQAKFQQAEVVNAETTEQFFAPLKPEERQVLHDLLTRLASSHTVSTEHVDRT